MLFVIIVYVLCMYIWNLTKYILPGLKFFTIVNDNDNIINIQEYHYVRAVYLINYIQRGNGTDTAFNGTYL